MHVELRPKDADHFKRPHINLTGMIVHGKGTYVFLTDECQPGGSNWHIECLMRGLDFVWQKGQRQGQLRTVRVDKDRAQAGEMRVEHHQLEWEGGQRTHTCNICWQVRGGQRTCTCRATTP